MQAVVCMSVSVRSEKGDRNGRERRWEVLSRQRRLGCEGEGAGTEVGEGIILLLLLFARMQP